MNYDQWKTRDEAADDADGRPDVAFFWLHARVAADDVDHQLVDDGEEAPCWYCGEPACEGECMEPDPELDEVLDAMERERREAREETEYPEEEPDGD